MCISPRKQPSPNKAAADTRGIALSVLRDQPGPLTVSSSSKAADDKLFAKTLSLKLRAKKHQLGFLQRHHIAKLLTKDDINQLFILYRRHKDCDMTAETIIPSSPEQPTYLTVIALLILLDRWQEIVHFVNSGLHDKLLPLQLQGDHCHLHIRSDQQPVAFLEDWDVGDREMFHTRQKDVMVPYLEAVIGQGRVPFQPCHYQIPDVDLPWHKNLEKNSMSTNGGFSTVYRVQIRSDCHGFGVVLDKVKKNLQIFNPYSDLFV
jgi:hypothetical protein